MSRRLWQIVFFSTVTLASLMACSPEVKEKPGALGKEATPLELQDAINSATSHLHLTTARVGNSITYEDNIRLELGDIYLLRKFYQKVTNIGEELENGTAYLTYTFQQDIEHYDIKTGEIIDEKHSEYSLPPVQKPAPSLQALKNSVTASSANVCDGVDVEDSKGLVYDCIKYFNLVSEVRNARPPEDVEAKPDCMGLPGCMMKIHYLKYDQVKWRNDAAVEKLTVTAEIAFDVADIFYEQVGENWSYTPAVLSLCYRGPLKIDNVTYAATQCSVLRDFE